MIQILEPTISRPQGSPSRPDASPYLAQLMACDGKLKLAAENLSISPSELIMGIAQDPEAQTLIDRYLRLYASLKAFSMLGEAQMQLHATVHELEAAPAAKHFTTLLTTIEAFTRRTPQTTTNNLNVFESALKSLPPEVADALRTLNTETILDDAQYNDLVASNSLLLKDDD